MTQFLFIDRDGTLIEEPADFQIDRVEKFRLMPGCVSALLDLKNAGFKFVMVTNQDGLGTARNPIKSFGMIQTLLLQIFSSQGVTFDEILICPHDPADLCVCRKPRTGLLKKYLSSNEMDRERSFVIGDRATDLELADNLGVRAFQIGAECDWSQIAKKILLSSRTSKILRKTNETDINLFLDLDAGGERREISTGLHFFDHMLEQISRHAGFDLVLQAKGDLAVDDHHLIEDVAIVLGQALRQALGAKRGINRFGSWVPMDEASSRVAIDLSGRFGFSMKTDFKSEKVGDLSTQMVPHFFRSLAENLGMSLHIEACGENTHHIVESMFKAVGRALREACQQASRNSFLPSTKGVL